MSEKEQIFPPPESLVRSAHITAEKYKELYARSLKDPEGFWEEMSRRLDWFTPPKKIKNTSFDKPVSIKWYEDGMLNACYNCIDRHLPEKENDVALIWEGDEPALEKKITYGELKGEVCRLANALKERGVSKGDRSALSMAERLRLRISNLWLTAGTSSTLPMEPWLIDQAALR